MDLHDACVYGNQSDVLSALQKGGSVDAVNEEGWTPLIVAARLDREDVAGVLLAHGANVDATTPKGSTALKVAAGEDI